MQENKKNYSSGKFLTYFSIVLILLVILIIIYSVVNSGTETVTETYTSIIETEKTLNKNTLPLSMNYSIDGSLSASRNKEVPMQDSFALILDAQIHNNSDYEIDNVNELYGYTENGEECYYSSVYPGDPTTISAHGDFNCEIEFDIPNGTKSISIKYYNNETKTDYVIVDNVKIPDSIHDNDLEQKKLKEDLAQLDKEKSEGEEAAKKYLVGHWTALLDNDTIDNFYVTNELTIYDRMNFSNTAVPINDINSVSTLSLDSYDSKNRTIEGVVINKGNPLASDITKFIFSDDFKSFEYWHKVDGEYQKAATFYYLNDEEQP